jgi:putative hydroxymethylpyrimidine transport system substrate-binding protein
LALVAGERHQPSRWSTLQRKGRAISKTSIQLEYFHSWPNHAGFLIAEDQGWFRDAGLDVEVNSRDPMRGLPVDHLIRGEVDFCIDLTRALLQRREQGARIVAVAAVNQKRLDAVITLKHTGIGRPRNLAGRRVGLVASEALRAALLDCVSADGGDAASVVMVSTGIREPTVLDVERGLYDASFAYAAWEGVLHPEHAENLVLIDPTDYEGLSYQPYMLITSENLLTRAPVLVQNVVAAVSRGYEQAIYDPDRAARTVLKVIPYFPDAVIEVSCRLLAAIGAPPGSGGC